jgi:ABC-type polysaccharide/polyol phosphate export permease
MVAEVHSTTLLRSLAIQRRVIGALLLREIITRFGRHNIGMLWLVAEPMLFTLGVAALWTATRSVHQSNIPIIAFAITGYSSVLLWRNTVNRCNHALEQNKGLLYHRNVRPLDVYLTRILLEAAGATASFVILLVMFSAGEWIKPPVDTLKVVAAWVMLVWFGAALGLTIGSATQHHEMVDRIWHPTGYLLFPLSGAAFMVDWLPNSAQQHALWLPMVHGVELLREGYFGNVVRTHHDMGYMAACNLVLSLVGLLLLRSAARRAATR